LTLVPYIATSGETKTKPTQHSVKELRSIGIQPDILVCRSEQALSQHDREKIALFTNVERQAVISLPDAKSIYQIPSVLLGQGMDELVVKRFGIEAKPADLSDWQAVVDAQASPEAEINIALVGKYTELSDAYKSIHEALQHAGIRTKTKVKVVYIDADRVSTEGPEILEHFDGILVPGGFGQRGIEGKIAAIQYARVQQIPFFGICLGMQTAVIEFARHVLGLTAANSTEFDVTSPYPVVGLIQEWRKADGSVELRDATTDLGGTMRLGAYACDLIPQTLAARIYELPRIMERHRHRYEVNEHFVAELEKHGMHVSGRSVDNHLVEIVEIPSHPFYIACQFHPEFLSTPRSPHPVFVNFVKAARKQGKQ